MPKHSKERFKSKVKINIELPHTCKICGILFNSTTGLANHIINKHDISYGEYIKNYLNIDVEKINKEWEDKREERKINQLSGLKKRANYIRGKSLKQRMSEEEYVNFRKSMKGVFSKCWYIKKYGKTEGIKKYNERSIHLSKKTFWHTYNKKNKQNWSKISQEMFWEIYKRIKNVYKNIYFGELNHEYGCETNMNFDFVIKDNKKIIEFNGDKFHANPTIYNKNDISLKFLNKTAEEIWNEDKIKHDLAKNKGYDIFVVWESDYLKNKEKILLQCLDHILK